MVLLGWAHAREWLGIVAATTILAAYYFVLWPIIVRLKAVDSIPILAP
jgi:hypothetical protein